MAKFYYSFINQQKKSNNERLKKIENEKLIEKK